MEIEVINITDSYTRIASCLKKYSTQSFRKTLSLNEYQSLIPIDELYVTVRDGILVASKKTNWCYDRDEDSLNIKTELLEEEEHCDQAETECLDIAPKETALEEKPDPYSIDPIELAAIVIKDEPCDSDEIKFDEIRPTGSISVTPMASLLQKPNKLLLNSRSLLKRSLQRAVAGEGTPLPRIDTSVEIEPVKFEPTETTDFDIGLETTNDHEPCKKKLKSSRKTPHINIRDGDFEIIEKGPIRVSRVRVHPIKKPPMLSTPVTGKILNIINVDDSPAESDSDDSFIWPCENDEEIFFTPPPNHDDVLEVLKDGTFKCLKCDKTHKNKMAILSHAESHRKRSSICPYCGVTISCFIKLMNHENAYHHPNGRMYGKSDLYRPGRKGPAHRNGNPLCRKSCEFCNKVGFRTELEYLDHLNGHKKLGRYICSCGQKRSDYNNFYVHKRDKKCREKGCKYPDYYVRLKEQHAQWKLKTKARKLEKSPPKARVRAPFDPERLKCKNCPYIAGTVPGLNRHFERRHAERTLPCPECKRLFPTDTLLRRHIREAHTEVLKCTICDEIVTRNMYNKHIKSRHSQWSYQCDECEKIFSTMSAMREHKKKMHGAGVCSSDLIIECAFCPEFKLKVAHYRRHEDSAFHQINERNWMARNEVAEFPCIVCQGLTFSCASELFLHSRRHHQYKRDVIFNHIKSLEKKDDEPPETSHDVQETMEIFNSEKIEMQPGEKEHEEDQEEEEDDDEKEHGEDGQEKEEDEQENDQEEQQEEEEEEEEEPQEEDSDENDDYESDNEIEMYVVKDERPEDSIEEDFSVTDFNENPTNPAIDELIDENINSIELEGSYTIEMIEEYLVDEL